MLERSYPTSEWAVHIICGMLRPIDRLPALYFHWKLTGAKVRLLETSKFIILTRTGSVSIHR